MTKSHKNNSPENKKKDNTSKHTLERNRGNYDNKSVLTMERIAMKDDLVSTLSDNLVHSKKSPTILIELSKRQWTRLKSNSIHLSGATLITSKEKSVLHNQVHYDKIEYGDNIKKQDNNFKNRSFKMKDSSTHLNTAVLNFPTIKDRMICITTDIDSIQLVNKNHILITSNNTPTCSDTSFHPSGKVLLFMIRNTDSKDPEDNKNWLWRDSLLNNIKKCKNSICISNGKYNHFNSQGYVFAFGNKALFGSSPVKSTVSQYVNKKGNDDATKIEIEINAAMYETLVCDEVGEAIERFKKYLPNIKDLMAPILTTAYNQQEEAGNVNFSDVITSKHGLWQSELCCNAITKDFHTEGDITYTLVSVPFQFKDNIKKKQNKPSYFVLKVNESTNIAFKMIQKTSFLFSGTMITHKQFCEDGYVNKQERNNICPFYNIACYGNERLFYHLRKSFRRNLGLEKKSNKE